MTKQSLANTGVNYVALQAYVRTNESLHIQGNGAEVNRSYGVAIDIPIEDFDGDMVEYFKSLPHTLQSKASDKKYFPLQAKVSDNTVHFQIPGPSRNRTYGASFDATDLEDLVTFIYNELD